MQSSRFRQRRVTASLTFDEDGLVATWREYYDAGVVVRAFRP